LRFEKEGFVQAAGKHSDRLEGAVVTPFHTALLRSSRCCLLLALLTLPALLPGCAAGAIGIVLALLSSNQGSGPAPSPPVTSVLDAPVRISGDVVSVRYLVVGGRAGTVELRAEWKPVDSGGNGTTDYLPADGESTPVIIAGANQSVQAEFRWNARADLQGKLGRQVSWARLRLRTVDAEGRESDPVETAPFVAGNEPPQVMSVELVQPIGRDQDVPVDVTVADSTSDRVDLQFRIHEGAEVRDASGSFSTESGLPLRGLTSTPEGKASRLIWRSSADFPGRLSSEVRLEAIPRDLEDGRSLTMPATFTVDNNVPPEVVILEISSSLDKSFVIPVRFLVSDAEEQPVSVILQWAVLGDRFPEIPGELLTPDGARELLAGGNAELALSLHILTPAQVLGSGSIETSETLPANQVRSTEFVHQGLLVVPPLATDPFPLPATLRTFADQPSDVLLLKSQIRIIEPDQPPGSWMGIREFDPRRSVVTLEGDLPGPPSPRAHYQVRAGLSLLDLPSTLPGRLHTFFWDSLRDMIDSGTDLSSTLRLQAIGIDRYEAGESSAAKLLQLSDEVLVPGHDLFADSGARAIAAADLNGDGRTDIAVLNSAGDLKAIKLYLQDAFGDLPEAPGQTILVTEESVERPSSLVAGDIDGDGRNDIAITIGGGNDRLQVYLQKQDGTIPLEPDGGASTGGDPVAVAMADVGGIPEVLVASTINNTLGQFRWNPSARAIEKAGADLKTASGPFAIAIGDLDGDGLADVAVACFKFGGKPAAGEVDVFYQEADLRTLNANPLRIPTGDSAHVPSAIGIGDLNHDGQGDLAVAYNPSGGTASSLVNLLVVKGSSPDARRGSLGSPADQVLTEVSSPSAIAIADVNGDGRGDLLIANSSTSTLGVFIQRDDATLPESPTQNLPIGFDPIGIVVTDLDGDSRDDVAVAASGAKTVSLYHQSRPAVLLAEPAQVVSTGLIGESRFANIAVGDLNGDGRADVAVPAYVSGTVGVFLQDAAGVLVESEMELRPGEGPSSLALGDLNGDGLNDLATTCYRASKLVVFFQDGSGGLRQADDGVRTIQGGPLSVDIGDLGGDGRNDVVVANFDLSTLLVFRQRDHGLDADPEVLRPGQGPDSVRITDLDADGVNDLAVACYASDRIFIFTGQQDGSFAAQPISIATGSGPQALAVADFDQDGRNDLAVAHKQGNDASVFMQDPAGGFKPPTLLSVGQHVNSVAPGDLDGDGWIDVVVVSANFDLETFSNLGGRISGNLPRSRKTPAMPASALVADLTGDGANELLLLANSRLYIYLGR
jgi:VCBS repeat protein